MIDVKHINNSSICLATQTVAHFGIMIVYNYYNTLYVHASIIMYLTIVLNVLLYDPKDFVMCMIDSVMRPLMYIYYV